MMVIYRTDSLLLPGNVVIPPVSTLTRKSCKKEADRIRREHEAKCLVYPVFRYDEETKNKSRYCVQLVRVDPEELLASYFFVSKEDAEDWAEEVLSSADMLYLWATVVMPTLDPGQIVCTEDPVKLRRIKAVRRK